MDELHDSRPGIVSMKAIARSHVLWPGIDNDLESRIHACTMCLSAAKKQCNLYCKCGPGPQSTGRAYT